MNTKVTFIYVNYIGGQLWDQWMGMFSPHTYYRFTDDGDDDDSNDGEYEGTD